MKHRGTIALAEELLARDRAEDVARMIDPLLDPDSFPSGGEPSDPGPMRLRILRARLYLLEEGRPEEARALLRPYVNGRLDPGTDPQAEALSRCWLGWTTAWEEDDRAVLGEALGYLRAARTTFEAVGRPRRTLWSLLGAAYTYLRLGAPEVAGSLLEEARLIAGQVEDRAADRWFDRLTRQRADGPNLSARDRSLRALEIRSNGSPGRSPRDGRSPGVRLSAMANRDPALVHVSPPMREMLRRLIPLADDPHPVLLIGERGTGRRRIARALDRVRPPEDSEWTVLEMSPDLPGTGPVAGAPDPDDELLPPRLERGLRAEERRGQTVYLHELGGSDPARIERSVERVHELTGSGRSDEVHVVGSVRADQIDDAHRSILQRQFPHWIAVPPLRDRGPDVPVLARRFLRALQPEHAPPAVLTDRALRTLARYHWPGNLRQLRNELDRALAYQSAEPAPLIHRSHLAPEIRDHAESGETEAGGPESRPRARVDTHLREDEDLDEALARTERAFIEQVLEAHDGHVASAAGRLGLTRQGLYKKMKRLDIERGRFTSEEATAE